MSEDEHTAHRVEWRDLPAEVRDELGSRLGGRVRAAVTQTSGFSHGMALRQLERLAELETHWAEQTGGETLLHTDLRPDDLLIGADDRVWFVDWAWPCRGAGWIDLVALGPSIVAAGGDPDPIVAGHPISRDADPAAVSAFVCALLGYWECNSRRPEPPRSPKLRVHQRRSAEVTRQWLRRRTGWM